MYLLADNKDLKAKLEATEKQMESLQKKTQQQSSLIGRAMRGIGGAIAAYIGVQAVRSFVNLAGQLDSVGRTFNSLARNAEGGSQRLLAAMREASAGTIDDLNLMKTANLALQLMGDDVAARLPEMANIARAAARATGQDVNFMLESLVVATGRQSILVLDNLGISSAVASQKMTEYAQSIGKTRDQLTDAEKKAAFFYAAMEAGNELVRRTGMSTLTLGERIQILEANMKNFTGTVATTMIPALNQLAVTFTRTGSSGTSVGKRLGQVFGTLTILVAMLVESLTQVGNTFSSMGKTIAEAWHNMVATVAQGMMVMQRALGDETGVRFWTDTMNNARVSAEAANAESISLMEEGTGRMGELTAELERLWENQDEAANAAADAVRNQTEEINNLTTAVGGANEALNEGQYLKFIGDDRGAALFALEEEYQKLLRLVGDNEERRLALTAAYTRRREEIEIQHNVFLRTLQNEWSNAFSTAYSAFESVTKNTLKEVMFGKGGWKEWRTAMKDILQQLVVDLMYAIAKALLLKAIMAGIGMSGGGGGFLTGAVFGKMFEKGRMPEYSSGRIPVLASGSVPSDHFPAFIGTQEAVINAASTRSNYELLAAMNSNPGAAIGGGGDINLNVVAEADGEVLFRVNERRRRERATAMGAQDYARGSVYK